MQEAPPAFVLNLNSEAISANPMNEPPINDAPPNQANSTTDERLMLDFSQGKAEAFTQLFERYNQPVFAFVPAISPILSERILRNEDQIRSGPRIKKPNLFVRMSFWSWKQWTAGLGAAAAMILATVALFVPALHRSQSRLEALAPTASKRVSVDSASVGHAPAEERTNRQPLQAQLAQQELSSQLENNASDLQSPEEDVETLLNPLQAPMIARSAALTIITKDFLAARAT